MRHIFLTGEKGVGKSTLINALLWGKEKIGGFRTVKSGGAVYLLCPGEKICAENRLFCCNTDADPERFNALGCSALSGDFACIVMDELGPHEENAAAFQSAVFRALDGEIPVIGVLQKADSAFLRRVAAHPKVRLIEITGENRDALYGQLCASVVGREIRRLSAVDSTNEEIKRALAAGDAPNGLTVIAGEQTAGRGRRGRSFLSAEGKGLYCSVLLKPDCPAADFPMLTAWTAVAVRDAIEKTCGVSAGIKWPNDLVVDGKKLCGILTELVTVPEVGVILGIGVNLSQTEEDFGGELASIAVSLAQVTGREVDAQVLTFAILRELDAMYRGFPQERAAYLRRYRENCLTRGEVYVLTGGETRHAAALGINEDFSLQVRYDDGEIAAVRSGEVSVRGIYGYV